MLMKKNLKLGLSVVVLALIIGGLNDTYEARRPLEPYDLELTQVENITSDVLSNKEMSRDIDHLIFALDNAYPGSRVYPEKYRKMISELQALKITSYKLTSEQLKIKIGEVFERFPDGHLSAQVKIELPWDEIESDSKRRISSEQTGRETPEITNELVGKKRVLNFKVPSFLIGRKVAETFLMQVYDNLNTTDALVMDLRGNSGGYQDVSVKLAALLWGGDSAGWY